MNKPVVEECEYLDSASMQATESTMKLASNVLGFEVLELWCMNSNRKDYHCTYAYVDDKTLIQYPSVAHGYLPDDKQMNLSRQLCMETLQTPQKMIWRQVDKDHDQKARKVNSAIERWFSGAGVPVRTKACCCLDIGSEYIDTEILLVCISTQNVKYTKSRKSFLDALGRAIYIAAFHLDNDQDDVDNDKLESTDTDERHLDTKASPVRRSPTMNNTYSSSMDNLSAIENASFTPRDGDGDGDRDRRSSSHTSADTFVVPIAQLKVRRHSVQENMQMTSFECVEFLATGSHANVYQALYQGQKVLIKMIKTASELNEAAISEFELEAATLPRLNHPNIIKMIGSGFLPRRFIVLEFLEGGILEDIMEENELRAGLATRLFRRPTFTYIELLTVGRELADAMHYLHSTCSSTATILHRDIKPDNIGFAADGTLKLFDFGLVKCIQRKTSTTQKFQMTGQTGTLRYMAPEVALDEPYNEKVDVYSFALVLWQMATDKRPYKGFTKDLFKEEVVKGGMRPKLDKHWPQTFSRLLSNCWQQIPDDRPGFGVISSVLTEECLRARGENIHLTKNIFSLVGGGGNSNSGSPRSSSYAAATSAINTRPISMPGGSRAGTPRSSNSKSGDVRGGLFLQISRRSSGSSSVNSPTNTPRSLAHASGTDKTSSPVSSSALTSPTKQAATAVSSPRARSTSGASLPVGTDDGADDGADDVHRRKLHEEAKKSLRSLSNDT